MRDNNVPNDMRTPAEIEKQGERHAAFMKHAALTLQTGIKFKARMVERGLTRAQTKCPRCGIEEALQGALAGSKRHMRMWCLTVHCSMEMME